MRLYRVVRFCRFFLRQRVSAINQHVATGLVRRGIASKVQVEALDLLGVALATERSHAVGLVDGGWAGAHLGVEEARRHDVDAGKLAPLAGERLAKVRDVGLGGVVHGLVGGHVDNVRAHAGCDDEVAEALRLEVLADDLGAEDDAVHYHLSVYSI